MKLKKLMEDNKEGWKLYERKGSTEMRPVTEDEIQNGLDSVISISEADEKDGCPKSGDMVARNTENHDDKWLVNETFFKENYHTD